LFATVARAPAFAGGKELDAWTIQGQRLNLGAVCCLSQLGGTRAQTWSDDRNLRRGNYQKSARVWGRPAKWRGNCWMGGVRKQGGFL